MPPTSTPRPHPRAWTFLTPPLPGDIGLTSITGPIGRLVRTGQWLNGDGFGSWEHAFVLLEDDMLIEAMPGGARIVPVSTYARSDVLFTSPAGLSPGRRLDICRAAAAYEGVPYSFLDYAALAAHRLRLPAPRLRSYVASTRHMICSQLVDQVYRDAGVPLFDDGRWSGYVTPGALGRRLAELSADTLPPAARYDALFEAIALSRALEADPHALRSSWPATAPAAAPAGRAPGDGALDGGSVP